MTEFQARAGGPTIPSEAIATADQQTILGDGTSEHLFRLASGPAEIRADFVPDLPFVARLGLAVAAIVDVPQFGVASVAPASAAPGGRPVVLGVVVAIDDAGSTPVVVVQRTGSVVLSTSQWDAVTGGSGGLASGSAYFLSATLLGDLTQTAPAASGSFRSQVGVALDATTLLLSTPSVPFLN